MNLIEMIHRQPIPDPWAEGEKIPWNDPDFSRRMLREHLSQAHEAASRRFETITEHIAWIHQGVLSGQPTRILDLGCGPGLYTQRLAQRGHSCLGIDFSPASLAYARQQAQANGLGCTYLEQDLRVAEYGEGYGLVMLVFGEFNVFRPTEAQAILAKACQALAEKGHLLLEVHTFDTVRRLGNQPPTWYSAESGLFSEQPHLSLTESFWEPGRNIATTRYFIIDGATGAVTRYAASVQAYTDEQYRALLIEAGFNEVTFFPSLRGLPDETQPNFIVIVAQKAADGR